jgi:hypothetical protein
MHNFAMNSVGIYMINLRAVAFFSFLQSLEFSEKIKNCKVYNLIYDDDYHLIFNAFQILS